MLFRSIAIDTALMFRHPSGMSGVQGKAAYPDRPVLQLVCSEVWGGNRAIDAPIELPGIRGKIFSQPCGGGRGGDVHYLSVCGSGLLTRILVADVVGHGEAVGTVSGMLHSLLRRHMNQTDQRAVLRDLNRKLVEIGLKAMTTAAAISYYPPSRRLSVSYAGHPPAWLYTAAAGRWSPLTAREGKPRGRRMIDLPLGVDEETEFRRSTIRVSDGDRLLVLTDGILEAPDAEGRLLGPDRLVSLLNRERERATSDLLNLLLQELHNWTGQRELRHDDVTALLIEFVPGPPGPAIWHAIKNRFLRPRGNSAAGIFADPAQAHPEADRLTSA